ncbi:hypothetical protein IL306_014622, partial [Fusarium sp. DS 682]
MSDIPPINDHYMREGGEGNGVDREASNIFLIKSIEKDPDDDEVIEQSGNDVVVNNTDADDAPPLPPPPRKKRRTHRNPKKGDPRETPCIGCMVRMADKGYEYMCCGQA